MSSAQSPSLHVVKLIYNSLLWIQQNNVLVTVQCTGTYGWCRDDSHYMYVPQPTRFSQGDLQGESAAFRGSRYDWHDATVLVIVCVADHFYQALYVNAIVGSQSAACPAQLETSKYR